MGCTVTNEIDSNSKSNIYKVNRKPKDDTIKKKPVDTVINLGTFLILR